MFNLVCPVAEYAYRTEYNANKIIEAGELLKEFIDLEHGQIGDEEVDIVESICNIYKCFR